MIQEQSPRSEEVSPALYGFLNLSFLLLTLVTTPVLWEESLAASHASFLSFLGLASTQYLSYLRSPEFDKVNNERFSRTFDLLFPLLLGYAVSTHLIATLNDHESGFIDARIFLFSALMAYQTAFWFRFLFTTTSDEPWKDPAYEDGDSEELLREVHLDPGSLSTAPEKR